MGSFEMFHQSVCHICGDSSFINDRPWPPPWNDEWNIECPECTNDQRTNEVMNSVQFMANRVGIAQVSFPDRAMRIIEQFVFVKLDGSAMFRTQYLRTMLAGPILHPMPMVSFRRFSYFSNGQAGSITGTTECIRDRIIAYVVNPS